MRFMTIVRSREDMRQPPQVLIEAIGKMAEEATTKGVFVGMGGLLPTAAGSRVRISAGKITVTDGPFTEAKEVIGGYAIFDVKSKAEAMEWAHRFMELHRKHWPEFEGETEVRQMLENPPGGR
jgi:hypothetical protein